nr:iron-sulfur cluster assembly scaffold protein [Sphingomicrobium nitratireducens]
MSAPYTKDILRLAAGQEHHGRLEVPDARVERRSRTCGAVLKLDLAVEDGKVSLIAVEPEACAYGQAATTLMTRHAAGQSLAGIEQALAALRAWLAGKSDDAGPWPEIDRLEPARERPGRHGAVLLPFEALADAMKEATRDD